MSMTRLDICVKWAETREEIERPNGQYLLEQFRHGTGSSHDRVMYELGLMFSIRDGDIPLNVFRVLRLHNADIQRFRDQAHRPYRPYSLDRLQFDAFESWREAIPGYTRATNFANR